MFTCQSHTNQIIQFWMKPGGQRKQKRQSIEQQRNSELKSRQTVVTTELAILKRYRY